MNRSIDNLIYNKQISMMCEFYALICRIENNDYICVKVTHKDLESSVITKNQYDITTLKSIGKLC